jgi:hypothetical protein
MPVWNALLPVLLPAKSLPKKYFYNFPEKVLTLIATGVTMHWKSSNNASSKEFSDYDRNSPEHRRGAGTSGGKYLKYSIFCI